MKIGIIGIEKRQKILLLSILLELIDEFETVDIEKEQLQKTVDLNTILDHEFDLAVLPLSLPAFASLRLVEQANQRHLATRFILASYTDADREALSRIYDLFAPQRQLMLNDIKLLLEGSFSERTSEHFHRHVNRVLQTATHFNGVNSDNALTIDDYLACASGEAIKDYSDIFECTDSQVIDMELEEPPEIENASSVISEVIPEEESEILEYSDEAKSTEKVELQDEAKHIEEPVPVEARDTEKAGTNWWLIPAAIAAIVTILILLYIFYLN